MSKKIQDMLPVLSLSVLYIWHALNMDIYDQEDSTLCTCCHYVQNKVLAVYLSDYMKIRQEHLSLPVYWLQSHRASPGLEYWLEYWKAWYLKQFTGGLKTLHFQWHVHSWRSTSNLKTWIIKCSSQRLNEFAYCVVYFEACSLSFEDLFKLQLKYI